jgi:TPR repeat protein
MDDSPSQFGRAPPGSPPVRGDLPVPEMTVPWVADEELEERWRRADAAGSADGAYAVGALLAERGDLAGAEAAWRRADERGSPAGGYELGLLLMDMGRLPEAVTAWRLADQRGSPWAAFALGEVAEHHGDVNGAEVARARALERAEVADRNGSADAACLVAELRSREGDVAASEAAWRRADERGSGLAACAVAGLVFERGHWHEAEAALKRGEERGEAAAVYLRGWLLDQRGHRWLARVVWRRARLMAAAKDEVEVFAAAQQALRSTGTAWFRAYPRLAVAVVILVAVIGALVSWPAAGAILVALATGYFWRRPLIVGSPIDTADTGIARGAPAISAGGLTLFGEIGVGTAADHGPMNMRHATERDRRYARFWPLILGVTTVVLAVRAAGAVDDDTVIRCGFGALALLIFWAIAWTAPSAMAKTQMTDQEPTFTSEDDVGGNIRFGVSFSPIPFSAVFFRASVKAKRLAPLIARAQSRRRANAGRDPWLRRARPLTNLLTGAVTGVFLAALAVAPHRRKVASAGWDLATTVVEMAAVAVGVAACLSASVRVMRRTQAGSLWASAAYLLVAAVVIAVAAVVGLLDKWVTVWEGVRGAL